MTRLFLILVVVCVVVQTVSSNKTAGMGKRKKARRIWFPVFVAFEGNGKSVYDAWRSQSECNPLPTSFATVGSQRHLRNSVVDDWNNTNIRMVKVEFFKNNQVVAWMTFNGRNTDKMNWFSKSNLAQSGFNDLGSRSTFNYFSIAGDHQRKFYVNQNYGGCAKDQGWMYVLDQDRRCPYERIGSIPMFLYTKNFTDRNWTRNIAEPADMMVISVLAEL
ncbi:unnamed protein product [Mytilus edulis]|uniref:Uncharacterized protein n=1 Tax=Mytilus edulis TaxID=6550 RepID=A0A8S3RAY2_MYTED|nr:unnamed protein product [Mytilus edulis]